MPAKARTPVPKQPTRYHALDSLRAWAMLLGLALHAAVPYQRDCPDWWAFCDGGGGGGRASVLFDLAIVLVHAFRMPVFFVMAGFFGALVLERRGTLGFVRHRATRIALPLAVAWLTIAPLTRAVWIYALASRPESGVEPTWGFVWNQMRDEGLEAFALIWHLWFLEYLLIYYALALGATLLLRRAGAALLDPLVRWAATSLTGPVVLAVPVAALSLTMIAPYGADGVSSAVPAWHLVAFYAVFFAFGWLLWRSRDAVGSIGRHWVEHTIGGAAAFAGVIVLGGVHHAEGHAWAALAGKATAGLMTTLLTFGVIGAFVRLLPARRAASQYLADSSYWLYLVHFPLIVWLGIVAARFDGPSLAKFGAVLIVGTGALLASYQLLVRHTPIGRTLNGPRRRRGTPHPATPPSPPTPESGAGA